MKNEPKVIKEKNERYFRTDSFYQSDILIKNSFDVFSLLLIKENKKIEKLVRWKVQKREINTRI